MDNRIIIRGAGELGSAVAVVLYRAGFSVLMSELSQPFAIRRSVSFSDAMLTGHAEVEGIRGQCINSLSQLSQFEKEKIPIVDDLLLESNPKKVENQILVDARMLKKRIKKDTSSIFSTIGLGPGFTAGENCMIAVETKRGHNMGRIIYIGPTSDNTGNPGEISGFSHQRVLYSKSEGKIIWTVQIGSIVNKNDIIGVQNGEPIHAKIGGKVRGLISPEVYVPFGIKIADIDPRGDEVDHRLISDKANAIARAVLEVVVRLRIDLERKSKRIEHGNENT